MGATSVLSVFLFFSIGLRDGGVVDSRPSEKLKHVTSAGPAEGHIILTRMTESLSLLTRRTKKSSLHRTAVNALHLRNELPSAKAHSA